MTGFGKAECTIAHQLVSVSIRALNSKQLELSLRIPQLFRDMEAEVRNLVSKSLMRGKVELSVMISPILELGTEDDSSQERFFNEAKIVAAWQEIYGIAQRNEIPISQDILSRLLSLPGVQSTTGDMQPTLTEEEQKCFLSLIEKALQEVVSFRRQEGDMLEAIFREKIANISALLVEITPYEEERVALVKGRIQEALQSLEESVIDHNRFEQELIYYIEKLDVNEEKSRLRNHLSYFIDVLQEEANHHQGEGLPIGKKLGFIAQEIGREVNTLGSKSNHAEMQKIVVRMKDELEQIREQVLNLL